MLADSRAFSGFAVDDLERARAWFKDPAGNLLSVLQER